MTSELADSAQGAPPGLSPARQRLLALRRQQRPPPPSVLAEPIAARQADGPALCSFSQEALWIVERLVGGAGVYNIAQAVRLAGTLDEAALHKALQALLRRHAVLRTGFEERDGVPVQVVRERADVALATIDASELSGAENDAALLQRLNDHAQQPFDLTRAPLLRAGLWRLGENEHVLLLVVHHIVADGWSMQVIARELSALYSAFSQRLGSPLAPLALQFADWAAWQRAHPHGEPARGEPADAALRYWTERLAGLAPLEFPTDLARPRRMRYAGAALHFSVPAALLDKLRALAREHNATLFMLLLAAFKVLLMRTTQQPDVSVGSPVAGRHRPELEGLVGYFVNTVVLRTDLSGNPSFAEALARVRRTALEAYTHQNLPFEHVVAALSPQRDLSRNPLYQVSFALNNQPAPAYRLEGMAAQPLALPTAISKFDLSLTFVEAGGELRGVIEYSTELFEPGTIERLASHVQCLLAGVAADAGQRLARLPLLSEAERRLVLLDWNRTAQPLPHHVGVQTLVEAQAGRTPQACAVVFGALRLSYAELNASANRLAHRLRALGVGPEVMVGVCMERSLHLPVALLAVLKAGGAFVPLDPELPAARLAHMLADTAAPVVLTQSHLVVNLVARLVDHPVAHPVGAALPPADAPAPRLLCLDQPDPLLAACDAHNPLCLSGPESLAYVIYTSGSTGRPKGVMSLHRGLSNHIAWLVQTLALTAADRLLQKTTISFDAAVWEFFTPWLAGATLVLARPGEQRDPEALARTLRDEAVSIVQFVPSALRAMLDEPGLVECTALRYVVAGGEALERDLARAFQARLPGATLGNFYGPSEASDDATHTLVDALGDAGGSVPIGRPIANVQCYVLDAQLQPLPIGAAGELFIGGLGLARGYLRRPELTAERFIAHPFTAGERLYRSGDRVRWRADGQIEFLGRIDFQVKIRGQRVELGEIEAALNAQPEVQQAVVVARPDGPGGLALVAYVVPHRGDTSDGPSDLAAELRRRLAEHLPGAMLPAAFVMLGALPVLANGKLDRHALPAPDRPVGAGPDSAPSTATEQLVWGLWRDVLALAQFGVHDDFFALGGHSLLATRLMARLREALRIELPLRVLFESPTVAGLARQVEQHTGRADANPPSRAAPAAMARLTAEQRRGLLPLSAAQRRMAFWHDLSPGTALYNLPLVLDLQGPLDAALLQACLRHLMQRHEILRTRWVDADGQRWQQIDDHTPWQLSQRALDGGSAVSAGALAADEAAAQEAFRAFDLSTEAPMRALLLVLGPQRHRLVWTLHHSVCDGWSANVLVHELCALYHAGLRGLAAALPPPGLQYTELAACEPQWLAQGVRQRELGYWQQRLADAPGVIDLPTDHPRPARQQFRGATVALAFSAGQALALQSLAQRTGTTLFMVVLALWQTLLQRYSGQASVVTGTVSANRVWREVEGVVGCLANTLALRADFTPALSVAELLAQVKATAVGAFDHQQLPFDEVVDALKLPRDSSRMPLVQTFVVLQPAADTELSLGDVRARWATLPSPVAKFDLSLELQARGATLAGCIEYDTALFEPASIERMAGHLHSLADAMCADPGRRVAQLPLLSEAERRLILVDWNRTAQPLPHHFGVQTLVEAQAERMPQACAVAFGAARLSYAELNASANRLAHRLRALGVGPEVMVGVCMERSLHLPVALLAVLKAGGAFVPLDPDLPAARLAHMLADTAAPVVLTQSHLVAHLVEHPVATPPIDAPAPRLLCLDQPDPLLAACDARNPLCLSGPETLAYVIYTSGSTGRPKGVMSLHRGLSNHVLWMVQAMGFTAADRALHKTTISFDAAVAEIFAPLLAGATLVLARPGEQRDPEALARAMRDEAITTAQFVPSALRAMLDEPGLVECTALRYVVVGGEALERDLARAFQARLPGATLGNFYGPSEASDDATHTLVDALGDAGGSVPIGRPIANVQCYVLDAQLQPLPIGAAGELFIGGVGLARGYLRRPELTAERFIAHPFAAGERLYRSGDRVRWRADGQIEFLGRIDFQVKIRGQRVELGEIEAALNAQPEVQQAVVVARDDAPGATRLLAYVVGAGADPALLKQRLAVLLPEYMLPSAWIVVPALPLLPNGKIDRRALPPPPSVSSALPVAPRTPTEQATWEIWRDLLGTAAFGVHDNFFDLGGQSLLAAQVMSRLRAALRIGLPLQALFDAPSVAGLALRADQAAHDSDGPSAPIAARGHDRPVPLSSVQRSMWLTERLQGHSGAYHMPTSERLRGHLDRAALERALQALVRRHDSLRLGISLHDGTPMQRLRDSAALPLAFHDLGAVPAPARDPRLFALLAEHADARFDPAEAPLARAVLVRMADQEHVFQLVLHHLVSDGWSAQLLRDDLAAHYQAFAGGSAPPPPPSGPGYLDYAAWEAARIESGALAPHTRYWTERLQGLEPLNLPVVMGGTAAPNDPLLTLKLPDTVAAGLAALARRGHATHFMVCVAAFKLLLMRWCDQTDVAVGTPIARRDRPELAQMVGPLLNTLVLRTDLGGDPSFEALLARVRDTALQAYLHQEQPFDSLVAALNPPRVEGRNPLFDVLVNALPDTVADTPLAGLASEPVELDTGAAKFALTLYIRSNSARTEFTLHYRGDLFAPGQMAALMAEYGHLLAQVAAQPQRAIASYSLITDAARAVLPDPRAALRNPATREPAPTLFAAFCAQAAARPDGLAVSADGGALSYGELEHLSHGLAGWLQARGIGAGDRVAIHADRSMALVVGLLGVARAGAVFCILDSAYPDERNQDCLAQFAPSLILVCGDHVWAGPPSAMATQRIAAQPHGLLHALGLADAAVAAARLPAVDPGAGAYVSFTSGTTGGPKGIVTAHAPLPHFVAWHAAQHGLRREDRFSMLSGLSHDPLLRDIFTPLSIGAALCIPAGSTLQQPGALVAWLGAQRVSVAHLTPALGDVVSTGGVDRLRLACLRHVFWGGEMLSGRTVERLRTVAPQARQVNFYGATETPQAMAHWAVPEGRAAHVQPIGRGIAGAQLLLLNPGGAQAGVGEPAEICVRTPYLAQGYLADDAQTRARFVPNPFSTDPRDLCYRTGDLGRYDSDGNVVLLGRIDDQIKVRGVRVEPAEIERVAQSVPGVDRAIVKAVTDPAQPTALLLFYSCHGGAHVPAAAIEARIRHALPGPMWPRAVLAVPGFERLPNGKIDLRALPDAVPAAPPRSVVIDAPRGEIESTIAQVWEELLETRGVGRDENFFDLGGHSLLALRAAFAIEQRCGLRLDLRRFVHESLAQLATPADPPPPEQRTPPVARTGLVGRLLDSIGIGGSKGSGSR